VITREKLGQIIRWELRWLVFPGLLIALILGGLAFYKAEAVSTAAPAASVGPQCDWNGGTCREWGERKARQFRNDRLGNARGIYFPKYMQRRIARKMEMRYGRTSTSQRDGVGDWFRDRLKITACLVRNPVGTHQGTCDEGQRKVNETMSRTMKVTATCGGTAVIGSLKGGGGWGAGQGGLACLWAVFMDLIL
jgi:hypothetical protein